MPIADERSFVLHSKREVERAIAFLSGLQLEVKPPWEFVIRKLKIKRSIEQNKRYHAVCSEISEQLILLGKNFHPDTLKEYFKRLFIGSSEVTMPDGSVATYGLSTTTLSVGEFADYMTKIDAWATNNGVIFDETRALLDQYAEEARIWRQRHPNEQLRQSCAA